MSASGGGPAGRGNHTCLPRTEQCPAHGTEEAPLTVTEAELIKMGDGLNQRGDSLDQVPGSREVCRVASGPTGRTVCAGRSTHFCFSVFCPQCFLWAAASQHPRARRKRLALLTSVPSAWPVPVPGDVETRLPSCWVSGQTLGVPWGTSIKAPPPHLPAPVAGPAHPLKSC